MTIREAIDKKIMECALLDLPLIAEIELDIYEAEEFGEGNEYRGIAIIKPTETKWTAPDMTATSSWETK